MVLLSPIWKQFLAALEDSFLVFRRHSISLFLLTQSHPGFETSGLCTKKLNKETSPEVNWGQERKAVNVFAVAVATKRKKLLAVYFGPGYYTESCRLKLNLKKIRFLMGTSNLRPRMPILPVSISYPIMNFTNYKQGHRRTVYLVYVQKEPFKMKTYYVTMCSQQAASNTKSPEGFRLARTK